MPPSNSPKMDVRQRQVATPRPGSLLSKQPKFGKSGRLRRLDGMNAPKNTLDDRPTTAETRPTTRTSFSSNDGTFTGGVKRHFSHTRHSAHDQPPKRLRSNTTPSRDLVHPSQDDAYDLESIDASTSNGNTPSQRKENKPHIRQEEYRKGQDSMSSRPKRIRGRRLQAAVAWGGRNRERRGSERSQHSPELPKSTSPDELQDSSPPPIQSDLYPPKSSRPVQKRTVERISDDELAIDDKRERRGKRPQKRLDGTSRRSPRPPPSLLIRRAISGQSVFEPEAEVEFTQRSGTTSWSLATTSGIPISFPWLQVDVVRLNSITHSHNSQVIIIHRPRVGTTSPKLILEFQDVETARQFILKVKDMRPTLKFVEKDKDFLKRALEVDLDDAQKVTPAKPPAESLDSLPAATLHLPESSPEPEATPGGQRKTRLIDQLWSGAERNSVSQQSSSPASKTTSTPWTRRSTRRSAPVGRLAERSPSLPRWSLNNTEWEKDWDSDLVYPSTGRDRATVHKDDLQRLDEGAFLNDNLIFCYLRYLQVEMERERPEISRRIYFMNTYFFEILGKSKGSSINYDGVKSWTSKVDIFSFDYIVVPVNEDAHWYLAIICNPRALIERDDDTDDDAVFFDARQEPSPDDLVSPKKSKIGEDDDKGATLSSPDGARAHRNGNSGPGRKSGSKDIRIITLDSLGGSHSKTCQVLRRYLIEEAKFRKNLDSLAYATKIGLTAKNIPSQENFCDCGAFLLGYAQRFLEDPDGFVATILRKGQPEWTVNPSQLRGEIRDTILRLHKQHREERATRKKKKRKRVLPEEHGTPGTGSPGTPASTAQDQEASAPPQDDASNNAHPSGDAATLLTTSASGQTSREISVELGTSRPPVEMRMSPRADDLRLMPPWEGGEMGSPSQRGGSQCLHGVGASDTTVPAKKQDEAVDVKPSVEHDDEPSSSNVTTLSPDPSCIRAQPEQVDEIIHSPCAHSPSNARRCETPQLPPAAPRQSIETPIEVPIEVPGDEPEFIKTIPTSPMSHRSAAGTVLGEKTPCKRSGRFGRTEGDDGSPRASKRLRETGTKSHFFPVDDTRTQAVFVPHKRGGPGRGRRKEPGSRYDKRQGQENSDAIDLTDQD